MPANRMSAMIHQRDFRKPLTTIRKTVIPGSVWCISRKMFVIFGTTKVTRKNRTPLPMKNMKIG